jgi:hypothetical protein
MVFDPKAPPSDRKGFMAWYDQQTLWMRSTPMTNPMKVKIIDDK